MPDDQTYCGVVSVLGAPNAGKSTLVNRMVGAKVSIVSPKVQTTRIRVRGVSLYANTQIIYVDTPGIFVPKRRLDRAMVDAAWGGAADADAIILLVDAQRGVDKDTQRIIEGLNKRKSTASLVLNKVDAVRREDLLGLSEKLNGMADFSATFMVSALKGGGVTDLEAKLRTLMPEGPWLFPEDEISDLPQRLLAAEITRQHRQIANDQSGGPDFAGLFVFVVNTRIPDMRVSQGYQLPRIGGVGQDLLITGHGSVEHHLADGVPFGPYCDTPEYASIGEGKYSWNRQANLLG